MGTRGGGKSRRSSPILKIFLPLAMRELFLSSPYVVPFSPRGGPFSHYGVFSINLGACYVPFAKISVDAHKQITNIVSKLVIKI